MQCERCGRELDDLLLPECDCPQRAGEPPPLELLAHPTDIPTPTLDAGVQRFVSTVLDELEDDD